MIVLQKPVRPVTKGVPAGTPFTFRVDKVMPTRKPFLSYGQQLDKLTKEKGLSIPDKPYAEEMLKQIGYFTLIGGYKEPFRNPTTKKYKDGTTFDEIVALYQFDTHLREVFLRYIMIFELKMRSLLSYYFTEKYGEDQSHYLTHSSYSKDPIKAADINKLISVLKNLALNQTDYHYITYQQKNYKNVPLWVLVKALTFGNLSFMYKCFPQSLQAKISKNFTHVREDDLGRYMKVLTRYRNVCAHNDRLFSYRNKDEISDTVLHIKLEIPKKGNQYSKGKGDLFSVVIALRYLLQKEDFIDFKRELCKSIDRFIHQTTHVTMTELLYTMGFPDNWKKISAYRL